jgi:ATP-dependent Lon protease
MFHESDDDIGVGMEMDNINIDKILKILIEKVNTYERIIIKTKINSDNYMKMNIITSSECNTCLNELNLILDDVRLLEIYLNDNESYDVDNVINDIQTINNKLSSIIKKYGTESVKDLIYVCLGNDYLEKFDTNYKDKFELIKSYVHPVGYKLICDSSIKKTSSSSTSTNTILEDFRICETGDNCSCYTFTSKKIGLLNNSVKILIKDEKRKQNLLIYGYIDDLMFEYVLNNSYVCETFYSLKQMKPSDNELYDYKFDIYLNSLNLRDYLIYNVDDIYDRYLGYINNVKSIKNKSLTKVVNDFLKADFEEKRIMLIQLLIHSNNNEYMYLAYLLYDTLSVDDAEKSSSNEQDNLYNSLPWVIKYKFKTAMKQTIDYTNNLLNFDINNKLPIEQRICLMKCDDKVKEKAMIKLKEVKSKTDDSATKSRQYLDGLLKIPFGIYKREQIFDILEENEKIFVKTIEDKDNYYYTNFIDKRNKYNSIEIKNNTQMILDKIGMKSFSSKIEQIKSKVEKFRKKELFTFIGDVHDILTSNHLILENNNISKLYIGDLHGEQKDVLKERVYHLLSMIHNNNKVVDDILNRTNIIDGSKMNLYKNLTKILDNSSTVNKYMVDVRKCLDNSVYGHDDAKRQIERIVGQWINGKDGGYCLGFEGPPGVGKCVAKDTPIMLSNGKIKMVQDITLKDKLMGDDGFERNVLALGSGREKMYRIEQVKGDDYVVNESHILSLKMSKAGRKGDKHQTILGKRYYKDDIVDICIKDYLGLPKYLKECLKGYKVGLNFREQDVSLDPYAIGYWLGDGHSIGSSITTIEKEVVDYFTEYSNTLDLEIKQGVITEKCRGDYHYKIKTKTKKNDNSKNKFYLGLKQYNLINNKHIPEEYKLTTRENRLSLLAGLIDSDGYHNPKNNSLEITQKNKVLADDIVFLVRSLGMRAMIKECEKSCTYKGEKKCGIYHRITISGSGLDEIPVLLERKKARPSNQIKNCLNTGIKIVPLEEDKYYGFQIDGNSRFLLGDFTVTHNTSLAKHGLSRCLIDENGDNRPFSFIAIGGSSNGSTLEGHNYTYVGSTWGRVVDILMEQKCMNPIIFIDEIDKVSKTENGREIISIMTHLVDPTQNDSFQDKYFSGIDIDVSKILFVFSYNDVSLIDRILLDRIHRIKFDNLTMDDKLVICNKHMLPELFEKMGQTGNIEFPENVLKYIINSYTLESGVRKLKELLYEIIGEINLKMLNDESDEIDLPIVVTEGDVTNVYLKDHHKMNEKKVTPIDKVGIICGLYANALGRGGVIPIETRLFVTKNLLDLKLTGQQGDVMKESMTVAKTLAWSLTSPTRQNYLLGEFENTSNQGIHIHCPEGATPKDGPSAGTAITVAIYSLLNNKPIKYDLAITGEINLQGCVTAIGGLDLKIIGGINAGVKTFLFPNENKKDFNKFMDKYHGNSIIDGIEFHGIDSIEEALKLSLVS